MINAYRDIIIYYDKCLAIHNMINAYRDIIIL